MELPPIDKGDFVVRTRSILWREVARVGGTKELARAHVNLPAEAVKALELDSKGDTVAFIIRTGSNNVILTNLFESQRSTSTWEKDPQIMLESLLSQVMVLKSNKMETYEKWENGEIDDLEFAKISQDIRSRFSGLTNSLKNIQENYFRGSDNTPLFIDQKTRSDYSSYANGILDYSEDLISKITSAKKYQAALDSAFSKGLISESEHLEEKQELSSVIAFLTDTLGVSVAHAHLDLSSSNYYRR